MGARGFSGKPEELKELEGVRPDRRNELVPRPEGGFPSPPADLSASAVQVWTEIHQALRGTHYVTPLDAHALAVFCDLVARWREAESMYRGMGPIVAVTVACPSNCVRCSSVADGGLSPEEHEGTYVSKYVRNPLVTVLSDLTTQIRAYAREFGLSPAARSSIVDPSRSAGGKGNDFF